MLADVGLPDVRLVLFGEEAEDNDDEGDHHEDQDGDEEPHARLGREYGM